MAATHSSDARANTKVQMIQGGDALVFSTGSELVLETGAKLFVGGSDLTATAGGVANAVGGVADSYKLARGEVTLDGSNPTPITTGLATVVAAVACFKTAVALGDDPNALTVDYGGSVAAGELDIHAWKNSSGTDPTQVASTNSAMVVSWIAIGTL
jgi:hypothetical protein